MIQSSINSFGANAVAGNTAASNVEGLVYTGMNAFYQTGLSFTGQNYGAGKIGRIKRISFISIGLVVIVGLMLSNAVILFDEPLLTLYGTTEAEMQYGILRIKYICTFYFLCGVMEVLLGVLRGMGYVVMPMIVSLSGACLLRIIWIMTIFKHFNTLDVLYMSYPVTWLITSSVHLLCLIVVLKKLKKSFPDEKQT